VEWTKEDVPHSPIETVINRVFREALRADAGSWILQKVGGKELWAEPKRTLVLQTCKVIEDRG